MDSSWGRGTCEGRGALIDFKTLEVAKDEGD